MPMPTLIARPSWVWLHRWVGLAMAGFLVVVGLTGSLLAFDHELERVFAPQLFAAPHIGAAPLDLATLAERAELQVPHGKVIAVTFIQPDQVLVAFDARKDPATGQPYRLGFDEYYVDPWTGQELGHRIRAALSEGPINVMPFVYELHWRLVAGDLGQWIRFFLVAVIETSNRGVETFQKIHRLRQETASRISTTTGSGSISTTTASAASCASPGVCAITQARGSPT